MTNINTFVTSATKCKTVAGLQKLLQRMKDEFLKNTLLSPLVAANDEIELVGGSQPFLRFELNQVISQHYITMVQLEIRDSKFNVRICTNRMKDGLGMSSQNWEPIEELDDDIWVLDEETVTTLVDKIYMKLMRNHAALLETMGIDSINAYLVACAAWRVKHDR